MKRFLSVVALAPLLAACPSSGTVTPPADDAGTGFDAYLAYDANFQQAPPTAACAGDPASCIQGHVDESAFTATPAGAVVELFRVFPSGSVTSISSQLLALDGTFAFSGLAAFAHYYVKVTAHFGTGADASPPESVAAYSGRWAVPNPGTPITVTVLPVNLELEETGAGANRTLQWVSAHVFDPSTGAEESSGAVSFSAAGIPSTPMPFTGTLGQNGHFYLAFSPAVAASTGYQVTALGRTFAIATEADFTGALTSPANGATVSAGQPLPVTWPEQTEADYMSVDLFSQSGATFTSLYSSGDPIASDVTTLTIPGADVKAGSLLLDVNAARAACGLQSDGCAYLLEAGSATLTGQ